MAEDLRRARGMSVRAFAACCLTRLSINGRARSAGIGVTSPTHVDDGRGLRTGTGTITRLRSPATCAYTSIICRYVTTSTPPISNTLPCVGIAENPDQVGERDKPWEACAWSCRRRG